MIKLYETIYNHYIYLKDQGLVGQQDSFGYIVV